MSNPLLPVENNTVKVDPANPEQEHLFQISPTLEESRVLDLHPVHISLGLEPSAFPRELGGIPASEPSPFSLPKGVFDTALRAPIVFTDLIWFFKGDSFFIYKESLDGNDQDVGDPHMIGDATGSGFTVGWPPEFATGFDAVLQGTGSLGGKVWFFKGRKFFRMSLMESGSIVDFDPTDIANMWGGTVGLSSAFPTGIDAAVHGLGQHFGVCWFFKGSQYVRYNFATDMIETGPSPIIEHWGGGTWPESFGQGIDFAFYGTGSDSEKIYFFRGDKYILYNLKTDRVEEGPKSILKNWPKLARFMLPPQLFIVEKYALRSFHGQMGRGPLVQGEQIKVAPGSKTEFFILTKKTETITQSSGSNIFESQSQQVAGSFSRAVREDQLNSGGEDRFDYQVETSFKGDASLKLIPFGVDTDIDETAKGASQDVRKEFAQGVSDQTTTQKTDSTETHKQQVTTADASHIVNHEIETGFKQTIDNSNSSKPLNCVIFQITQEYINVLSLVDVKLAFHNNNRRDSKIVSIRDRDISELLDECIVEPQARVKIMNTLKDVFQNIVDHVGDTRSIIAFDPNDPSRFQVDRKLNSTFEVKDSSGSTIRTIVTPGIILNVDRPVVLTPNTLMATVEIP